jgi:hypothetical protein
LGPMSDGVDGARSNLLFLRDRATSFDDFCQ